MLQPKYTDWLNGYKQKSINMLSTRDTLQIQGHIETESEGKENGIPCKWKSKERWSSKIHIKKIELK